MLLLEALTFFHMVLQHSKWNLRYRAPQRQIQHHPETTARLVTRKREKDEFSHLPTEESQVPGLDLKSLAQHQGLVMKGKPLYLNLSNGRSLQALNPNLLSKTTPVSLGSLPHFVEVYELGQYEHPKLVLRF